MKRLCAVLAAGTALFAAAPATATVTSSEITSVTTPDGFTSSPVASPLFSSYDTDASTSPVTTVSGRVTTDDANASDQVEIRCYSGTGGGWNTIESNVPVNPDGTFTSTGSTSDDFMCHMVAVDQGYGSDPIDYSTFSGPVYGVGSRSGYTLGGTTNAGKYYAYAVHGYQLRGYMQWEDVGECGLSWSGIFYSTFSSGSYSPFDCAGAMYTGFSTDGFGRSEMQVDGHDAFNSYGAANYYYWDGTTFTSAVDNENFPVLTWNSKTEPDTGDTTVTESEQLVHCGDHPTGDARCDPSDPYKFHDSGVRFNRSIKQSSDGQQATVTDTYASTDGAQHAIDMEYDNYSYESNQLVYDIPGAGGYSSYCYGDSVELPAQAMGSIYIKDALSGDDNPQNQAPGAVTYTTQPDRLFFNNGCNDYYGGFVLQYRRTVPAGGSISITHVFTQASSTTGLRRVVSQYEDAQQPPTVSIDSPADGSTTQASEVTVIGKASDNADTPTLKVNGIPTPVQPDGSWSQRVSLSAGANTITAVATDAAGNAAQAVANVTYQPPNGAPVVCQVPNVVGISTAQAVTGLTAANCQVGKQTAVTSSTVKAGNIVSQSMAPGTLAANGTKVDLVVSRGAFQGTTLVTRTARLRGATVSLKVRCPASTPVANGTLKLRSLTGKHTTLGTASFQCPRSGTRTVKLRLSKAAVRTLKKHKSNRVMAYIVSRGAAGEAKTITHSFRLIG